MKNETLAAIVVAVGLVSTVIIISSVKGHHDKILQKLEEK